MTLDEMVNIVRFVMTDKAPGKKLDVDTLNEILKLVDVELLSEFYGRVGSDIGFETEQIIGDALRPFRRNNTPINLISGLGVLPSNYMHWVNCYYISGSDKIPIELVTGQESEQRQFNAITKPTLRHPIVDPFESTIFQVYPATGISTIYMNYIRKPTPASYVLKIENGVEVYDSALSVQPEWRDAQHPDYVRHILKQLSISVENQSVVQYVEAKQQQTA